MTSVPQIYNNHRPLIHHPFNKWEPVNNHNERSEVYRTKIHSLLTIISGLGASRNINRLLINISGQLLLKINLHILNYERT
jgi:hypothetical protein